MYRPVVDLPGLGSSKQRKGQSGFGICHQTIQAEQIRFIRLTSRPVADGVIVLPGSSEQYRSEQYPPR